MFRKTAAAIFLITAAVLFPAAAQAAQSPAANPAGFMCSGTSSACWLSHGSSRQLTIATGGGSKFIEIYLGNNHFMYETLANHYCVWADTTARTVVTGGDCSSRLPRDVWYLKATSGGGILESMASGGDITIYHRTLGTKVMLAAPGFGYQKWFLEASAAGARYPGYARP